LTPPEISALQHVRVRVKQEGEINERIESGEITVDGIVSVAVADRERRWLLSAI
jgi:cytoskeletal protein CcmA (bactofilin family)